jgi:hypothetical protein
MHDELFKRPTIIARYRAGPYAESRERFLKQAYADGYSLPTVGRIAWGYLSWRRWFIATAEPLVSSS